MIKVFTTNKNGKIELTKDELQKILDEAYWDGYRVGNGTTWTYTTPSYSPYRWVTTTSSSGDSNYTITYTDNAVPSNITLTNKTEK